MALDETGIGVLRLRSAIGTCEATTDNITHDGVKMMHAGTGRENDQRLFRHLARASEELAGDHLQGQDGAYPLKNRQYLGIDHVTRDGGFLCIAPATVQ